MASPNPHPARLRRHPILLSVFPDMDAAAAAIVLHTEQILVKPVDFGLLMETIHQRLSKGASVPRKVESVADILGRTSAIMIQDWYENIG